MSPAGTEAAESLMAARVGVLRGETSPAVASAEGAGAVDMAEADGSGRSRLGPTMCGMGVDVVLRVGCQCTMVLALKIAGETISGLDLFRK